MANWQNKAINYLMQNKGMDITTASRVYARAVKRTKGYISKGFNIEFEAYASIAYENNFIKYDIKSNRLYVRKTGIELKSGDFEKQYTIKRLSNFATKYDEIGQYLWLYEHDAITLQELNDFIEDFKLKNKEYLKEGS